MNKKNKNMVVYDDGDDSLTFLSKERDAEYTINTGMILLSINKKHKIVAIELMGANKNFKIPNDVLSNINRTKVSIIANKEKKCIILNIEIFYDDKKPMIVNLCANDVIAVNETFKSVSCA